MGLLARFEAGRVGVRYPIPNGSCPHVTGWSQLRPSFRGRISLTQPIVLIGSAKGARWVRWFATITFLIGTGLLLFIYFITEYDFPALADSPIFPTGWRVTCLSMAIYGVIVMLIAWLPTTDRIRK